MARIVVAELAALAVVVAACGSDDGGKPTGSGGSAGNGASASGGAGGSSGVGTGGSSANAGASSGGAGGAGGTATGGSAGTVNGGTGGSSSTWLANVYGNPWSATSLQNWNIGSPKKQKWSYRFKAPRAGTIHELHVFFVANPANGSKTGYAAGTGGTVRVQLCADDKTVSHTPKCDANAPSATLTFQVANGKPKSGAPKSDLFRKIAFAKGLKVQGGIHYHAVFSNVDANPEQNWIGLDGLTDNGTNTPSSGRPGFDEWTLLMGTKGSWTDWSNDAAEKSRVNTPVMSVIYDDNTSFGCGYMEVWPSATQSRNVNAKEAVRERFVASKDVTATGVHVRIKRVASGGALKLSLVDATDKELYSTSIDASKVNATRHAWVGTKLTQPWLMKKGKEYRLVLRGSGGGSFLAHCIRDGGSYKFSKESVFADGYAEFDRDDGKGFLGWYGWSTAGSASYKDGDLQFFFDTKLP